MAAYYKQVKLQEYNDAYQQAQLDIVLEGERNLASQAEIINRLTQLQQEIANQAAKTLIPLNKTNALTNVNASEAPAVETSKFPGMTATEYENIMTKKKPLTEKKKTIIKLPPIEKKKSSAENTPTLLSPTSTEATFLQSSMGSPKKTEKKTLTGLTKQEITNEFAKKIKVPVKIENIEIRVERGKPIYKDLNSGIDIVKPDAGLIQRLYNEYKIQTGSGIKQRRNAKGQFTRA